jgi:type I restriction-modification system DNA methylase subunit
MEDYTYYDKNGQHQVGAVGFFGKAHNSSTACIAVIENGNANEEHVLSYHSLGCPVVLACSGNFLQFWHYSGSDAVFKKKIGANNLDGFFRKQKEVFSPESIYRAKTIGRVKESYQLGFVDRGLMPAIEKQEGEYLADLMVRVINGLYNARNKPKMTDNMGKWLFQAAFWLIGAKILKDKKVESFTRLRISNIESLIGKVQKHYSAADRLDISKASQRKAMGKVAREIVEPVYSLSHITNESLAYVYENTLVNKNTRKALGTHATPSWLVNYIVWQLIDWIEEIPEYDRIILEPACGHAPFLTAGARLLSFLYVGCEEKRHDYLKSHLVGIEKDIFAQEIARLSLTLADIPNRDGWDIRNEDVYNADVLRKSAEQATILLCNPPFEKFSKEEKLEYDGIETGNKAAEVLAQTLPYMKDNSVFGIILPEGFLDRSNLANLRKYLLDDFEIRTICNLPDNVFAKAGHPSIVLLGRKKVSRKNICHIVVPKAKLENFINNFKARLENVISKENLYQSKYYSFKVPELSELWKYCHGFPLLQNIATVGRGIEYEDFSTSIRKNKFPGAVKGYARFEKIVQQKKADIEITELPDCFWISSNEEDIKNWRYGRQTNMPRLLANYGRAGRDIWRIRGMIDLNGCPVSKNLLVIDPNNKNLGSLFFIWALINSPFTNAYMYCHCMKKNNLEGVLRNMPVPFDSQELSRLEEIVKEYFSLSERQGQFMSGNEDELKRKKKKCLLKIDAEVLRLYDLPPRLEKQLLDFFAGHRRKGVDFDFDRYYPENFGSYIPLRMFISEEFQNSTVENVEKWIEDTKSPQVLKALDNAVKAFEGE